MALALRLEADGWVKARCHRCEARAADILAALGVDEWGGRGDVRESRPVKLPPRRPVCSDSAVPAPGYPPPVEVEAACVPVSCGSPAGKYLTGRLGERMTRRVGDLVDVAWLPAGALAWASGGPFPPLERDGQRVAGGLVSLLCSVGRWDEVMEYELEQYQLLLLKADGRRVKDSSGKPVAARTYGRKSGSDAVPVCDVYEAGRLASGITTAVAAESVISALAAALRLEALSGAFPETVIATAGAGPLGRLEHCHVKWLPPGIRLAVSVDGDKAGKRALRHMVEHFGGKMRIRPMISTPGSDTADWAAGG